MNKLSLAVIAAVVAFIAVGADAKPLRLTQNSARPMADGGADLVSGFGEAQQDATKIKKKRVLLQDDGERVEMGAVILYKHKISSEAGPDHVKSFMNVIVKSEDSKAAIKSLLAALDYDRIAKKTGERDEPAVKVYTFEEAVSQMRGPDIEARTLALRLDLEGHLAVVKSYVDDGN